MSEERVLENFGFAPGTFDKMDAWDGGSRANAPIGDYRLKIVNVREKMKEGGNYKMAIIDYQVLAAYDEQNKIAVGMEFGSVYAGDANAPDAMLKRTKHLFFNALGLATPPKSAKEIIGREIDATVTWRVDTGKDTKDPLRPQIKQYVKMDIKGERKVGTPRPKSINPWIESAQALALENGTAGAPQAWEQAGPQGPQAATPASLAQKPMAQAPSPAEENEQWTVDAYRALVAMKHDLADQAKAVLQAQSLPIDGPIDEAKLPTQLREQYVAYKAHSAAPSLPALDLGKKAG